MSSINGKSLEQCITELRKKRPMQEKKGSTGYWYYPIELFIDAMDEVFGSEHYSHSFSEPVFRQVSSGQEMLTVRCTITLTGDDGTVVKRIDGFGDREIAYSNDKHRADLGNFTSTAAALAFKDACKYLGIFGYRTTNKPENKAVKSNDELVRFSATDMFYQQGESKGNPIWKLPVKLNGSDGEVVFYHNQTAKKAEQFNSLFSFVQDGLERGKKVTVKLKVRSSGDYNGIPQYVFKDFEG